MRENRTCKCTFRQWDKKQRPLNFFKPTVEYRKEIRFDEPQDDLATKAKVFASGYAAKYATPLTPPL
jgi:hypothetical protein